MYEVLPILPEVAQNLPATTQVNAPSAYNSAVNTGGYMPRSIARTYPVMPQDPNAYQQFLQKMGWYDSSSTINKTTDETKGATQAFGDLGFDKKLGAITEAVGTVAGAYYAHQQAKMAKQQIAHNQMEAERNYQAQRKITNSQLEDRQKRRVEEAQANGRTTTSVADYMANYGVQ